MLPISVIQMSRQVNEVKGLYLNEQRTVGPYYQIGKVGVG